MSKNQVLHILYHVATYNHYSNNKTKIVNFKKEAEIAIKSKETSIASHAVRPVGNTELYAPA